MLVDKKVIYQVKRKRGVHVYMSTYEVNEALEELTTAEFKLYNLLYGSVLKNVSPSFYKPKELAILLNVKPNTVSKLLTSLKQKRYVVIEWFKDNSGTQMVRVVLGKDQVDLKNMGIDVEITSAKHYAEMLKRFNLLEPNISQEEKEKRVQAANKYYLSLDKD